MTTYFRISADILHTQGPLTGITCKGGWSTRASTAEGALSYCEWIDKRHESGAEIDGLGGVHFRFVSAARVDLAQAEG